MRRNPFVQAGMAMAALAALGVGLFGCGGGGGDDETPIVEDLLTISSANRDAVARATASALYAAGVSNSSTPTGAGPTGKTTLAAAGAADGKATAQAAWSVWPPARAANALVLTLDARRQASLDGLRRPLAYYGPYWEGCLYGGGTNIGWNDHDDNGEMTVGDVMVMDFVNCSDVPGETMNGHVEATLTAIGETSLGMNMAMTGLAYTMPEHAVTIDGSMAVDYRQLSTTLESMNLTASGPVTVAARTHGFTDTVTIHSGFVQNATFDATLSVPDATGLGATSLTASGRLQSVAMGGVVEVSTPTPLVTGCACANPTSGTVAVRGKASGLTLNALAGDVVRVDLDHNGDGTVEVSTTETWDWLF